MDIDHLVVILCTASRQLGLIFYVALAVIYCVCARERGPIQRQDLFWQCVWLLVSLGFEFLQGATYDYLLARQVDTNLFFEVLLAANKIVPRTLWFLVIAAAGKLRVGAPDKVLILLYAVLMLLTPRMSNVASLAWGIPFLWGGIKLLCRQGAVPRRLAICLGCGVLLHLTNAAANIAGLPSFAVAVRGAITAGYYPIFFAVDIMARREAAQHSIAAACTPCEVPPPEDQKTHRGIAEVVDTMAQCYGLTPRETEIVRYIYGGMTNRQIAEQICTAEGTVKAHSYNIYTKLGINRRTQLVLAVDAVKSKIS